MKRLQPLLLSVLLVLLAAVVGCDAPATEAPSTDFPLASETDPAETEREEASSSEELPTETESEESTAEEDPTQYPARAELHDVSAFEHKSILYGSRMWNTIASAPTVSIDALSSVDGFTWASYGIPLYPSVDNFTYFELYLKPDTERLKAVCKLDDTHLCAVEKVQRQLDGRFTYMYGIYEWAENPHPAYEGEKSWLYTYEYYVAANAISYGELSDIKIGDSADKLYEIAPCVLNLAFQRHLNFYANFVALLLKDGVAFVEIENVSNNSPDYDSLEYLSSKIRAITFFPYGEPAEMNGYSLVMPTAENLPPLPSP